MFIKKKYEYPLYIAFIWHMHQPWYLDGDIAIFPWVRVHSLKDYLDMVSILDNFPNIKQTFNLVPSLIEQIKLISEKKASDIYWEISKKPSIELSVKDKKFIIKWMCPPHYIKRISNFKSYKKLLIKVENLKRSLGNTSSFINKLTDQEYRDLQLWYDLSWFDPVYMKNNRFLNALVQKGEFYTEDEKSKLYDEQLKIIEKIIPKFKQMKEERRIELICSPYYHPILPLLCDNKVAIEANPNSKVPHNNYSFPHDARTQMETGLDFHKSIFGSKPKGIWLPEMAISNEALKILMNFEIFWTITDQHILSKTINEDLSLGSDKVVKNPHLLYKPYTYTSGNNSINLIFRDQILSDLIGFVYNNMTWEHAINDLMDRLERIYFSISSDKEPYLVTIAMDGENCWEYYENDGYKFISNLYKVLGENSQFRLVSVSEYLSMYPPAKKINSIKPGSWVRSDFTNWIGGDGQNQAWDYLYKTRIDVKRVINSVIEKDTINKIFKRIYIAEGSDWFWWFGDNEKSGMDELWEERFREHLLEIYKILEISPPDELKSPIKVI